MQQSHIDIDIKLIQSNNLIELECRNRISEETKNIDSTGIGVKNAETRLKLLYPNNYEIKKEFNEKYYSIYLKINLKNES
jgi:LytS/YehU family sensor histidine kinase